MYQEDTDAHLSLGLKCFADDCVPHDYSKAGKNRQSSVVQTYIHTMHMKNAPAACCWASGDH